jgi:hypothetical protein
MTINTDIKLGVTALSLYIIGGLGTFGGIALMTVWKNQGIWGWGSGHSLGMLFICVGVCLSILGVILMRVFRNRGLI